MAAPKAKKAVKKPVGEKKKARRRPENYNMYIARVLKQVYPNMRIGKTAVSILNSFVVDSFGRIADEASNLVKYSKKSTLGSREVQAAVRLVLPAELSKHAVAEGAKAVNRYAGA